MRSSAYAFETTIIDTSFDAAVVAIVAALASEDFGILTRIDVKGTLREKLDVRIRRYEVLGACNPSLANIALAAEPNIGLLLPCNVVVQEIGDAKIRVSIADPRAMFELTDNPVLKPVAREAELRLRRALALIS